MIQKIFRIIELTIIFGCFSEILSQQVEFKNYRYVTSTRSVRESIETLRNNRLYQPPNIVVMLADDLGYGDLSISGHPTSYTPNIDRLASAGKFFTQFYVTSPVCSPSRSSLLTGRYQVRSGVYPGTFVPDSVLGLPLNETTIAKLLKTKGYSTLITGKWHLGVGFDREFLPTHHGFDEYLGVPYSQDMCPCNVCFPNNGPCFNKGSCWADSLKVSCPLFSNTSIIEQPVNLPSLSQRLVNKAKTFIRKNVEERKPFFLYFPFHHVHHPQFASGTHEGTSERGSFGDSLAELDDSVGQIHNLLDTLGVSENTLIWFTSDNGPSMGRESKGGCAGALRCGKGTTFEGGVRVPTFVTWPGVIRPGRCSSLASTLDILPTITALTGASTNGLTLDGFDISDLLLEDDAPSPREFYAVYAEGPDPRYDPLAVVWGQYKAHFYTKGSDLSDANNYDPLCPGKHKLTKQDPPLLFDLGSDPGERWNIAAANDSKAILERISSWRDEHRSSMTWMPPLTEIVSNKAQPCCKSNKCSPFPECCDCNGFNEQDISWINRFLSKYVQ